MKISSVEMVPVTTPMPPTAVPPGVRSSTEELCYTSDEDIDFQDEFDESMWPVVSVDNDESKGTPCSTMGDECVDAGTTNGTHWNPQATISDISSMSSAQLGSVFDQEPILDAILDQQDPVLLEQAFQAFLSQRHLVEQEHTLARQKRVDH